MTVLCMKLWRIRNLTSADPSLRSARLHREACWRTAVTQYNLERITDFCSSPHLISAYQLLRLNSELFTQHNRSMHGGRHAFISITAPPAASLNSDSTSTMCCQMLFIQFHVQRPQYVHL